MSGFMTCLFSISITTLCNVLGVNVAEQPVVFTSITLPAIACFVYITNLLERK